jgi:protein involved in polysaccharide export with SLBB domain
LRELLDFAGRMEADALLTRVQIDRIVPPGSRSPGGPDRVLQDIPLGDLFAEPPVPIALRDGDLVTVFGVSGERRNRIVLDGQVRRAGVYEWTPGLTIWDAIARAEGLAVEAYTPRAHIYRLNLSNGTRSLFSTPLLADASGQPMENVALADLDSIVIYSQAELRNAEVVRIDGYVRSPGDYPLASGMTLYDLILAAGGFTEGANYVEADVARLPDRMIRTDTTANLITVSLASGDPNFLADGGDAGGAIRFDVPFWLPRADEFALEHGDRVFIRKAAGYEDMNAITIEGEIAFPGTYVLETRGEKLNDVLARAGGLTPEAYAPDIRLFRGGQLVSVDAARALRDPNSRYNLILESGDAIEIPRYDPTVLVTGAVAFETRVLYEPGRGLDHYIERAGGYALLADPRRVTVTRPDGERRSVRRFLTFSRKPDPAPGSVIFVPARPEEPEPVDIDAILSRTLSLVTIAATLIIAIDRVQ